MTKSKARRQGAGFIRLPRLALWLVPLVLWASSAIGQTWTPLSNAPPISIGYMALSTDGTVLAHARTYSSADSQWYKLTPDSAGSYINGTWSQIASMPAGYAPIDFAGGVLTDGKLLIEGGEYNDAVDNESNLGAIYDPVADTWTSVNPPAGWPEIGDASGVILANGRFMMSQQSQINAALFDEAHLSWTITGTNKPDYNVEENWILLPNGKVLNVETYWYDKYNATGTASELYDPSTGLWSDAGSTIAQLWDSAGTCGGKNAASYEIGPMVLRPDGTVFATGANACGAGHSAIYHTATGTWTVGPDFPNGLDFADAPAAVETNGNVLMMASPGIYQTPPTFLEWNGSTFTTVTAPTGTSSDSSWYGAMLELPSGQILFSDLSTSLQVWTPAGTYQAAWQPTVSSVSTTLTAGSTSNPISGTQFNGLSQGAYYGDDQQMATNYPLVRIVNNASGTVTYCRTHDHSTMGVQTGSAVVSTNFDVPSTIPSGASTLYIVANGIPSAGTAVTVGAAVPGFSLAATTATVTAGSTGTSTVTETAIGGFNSAVTLSVSGLPAGVTAAFSPASISGSGASTLTFTAASNVVAPGGSPATSTVTLTGTAASGTIKTTTFYLTLVAAPAGTLTWSPVSYDFGTLISAPDSYTANVPFTLTNTGSVPVTITGVSVDNPGGEFNLNGGNCSGTLAPSASCQAFVYFTPSNQPPGVFTGNLLVTDTALNSPQTVALTGTGSASGFNISADSVTVAMGSTGTATVTQIVQGGFNSPVTLSANVFTSGVTATFNPPTITGAGTSTITYTVSPTATPGSYGVLLTGTSATGSTQVYTTGLTIVSQLSPSFSLSAAAASVTEGSTGSSTVTESITNGFNVPVALSASGMPSGVTASFSPPSITGAGSSTLTFTASSAAPAGTYTVTVTGAPASIASQATTLTLTVTGDDTIFANGFESSSAPLSFSGTIAAQGAYIFTPNFTSGEGTVAATLYVPAGTSWRFVADNATTNQTITEQDGAGPLAITFTAVAGNSYNFFVQATTGSGAWSIAGSHPPTVAGVPTAGVSLNPASFDLGSVVVNGYSKWHAFTVTNSSSTSVSLSSAQVKVSSGQFHMRSYCGSSLAAGSTCTIWVLFAPVSDGVVTGELAITAGSVALNSQLNGTGFSGPAGPHQAEPPIPQATVQPLNDRGSDGRAENHRQ